MSISWAGAKTRPTPAIEYFRAVLFAPFRAEGKGVSEEGHPFLNLTGIPGQWFDADQGTLAPGAP